MSDPLRSRLGDGQRPGREVPAAFSWHGTLGDDAQNPTNWAPDTGVPSSGDSVSFTAAARPGESLRCRGRGGE